MAKTKKKRQSNSKRRKFKPKDNSKTSSDVINPFELHRNKVKHNIIGRKLSKNEFGNKGLSRNRAYHKRKNTILEEYKNKHKSGKGLQDLRNKDNDDMKRLNESIDIPLIDDIVLTHKGKHLNDFIDDTIGSDDEDIDLFSRPEFVESTHFGGGSDGRPKSANEVLSQIMDEKRDKQLERQANIDLTERLDTEWNEIKDILRHKGAKQEMRDNKREDFDVLVKELMFGSRDKPMVSVKNVDQKVVKESDDKQVVESVVNKSFDSLFKDIIEIIERQKNWTNISEMIKESINDLLPQISDKYLTLLVEKYQTVIETKSDFTAKSFAFILFGIHFKQTELIVKLILIQMVNKIKYNSFKEIAIVLVIIKVLLMISNRRYIPEVFNAILNIICLSQTSESIDLTIGQKQRTRYKCILNMNECSVEEKSPLFRVDYIFDETLSNFEVLSESQIKSMLLMETLKRAQELCDLYSNMHSFNELVIPLKKICSDFLGISLPEDIRELLTNLLSKLSREEPKGALIETRPKPFMLPMFEPKFDDKSTKDNKNSKKKLQKKYNRELKGAQRELRKDSQFMRNTWIQEINSNDERRHRRVKQLLGDLAQQQGVYKKNK